MKTITVDGNTAVAMSAYATNEAAIIYPITPSSPMAESCDSWAGQNQKNMFGFPMKIVEMQSEAGAAGALHGSLMAGTLTTTFTASQGLLLMIPNMFKIAGELLPCVFHVSARAIATHALSIFGDHSDVMACRQTGFCMLCSNNVQEAHDFATIAMMASLNSSVPFLHFFDGFRTSHEIAKISTLDTEEIKRLMPMHKILEFRARALSPAHPKQMGTAQNPDVFFQNRERGSIYYVNAYNELKNAMKKYGEFTGRKYKPYEYSGSKTAKKVIVLMGSACDTIEEVIKEQKLKDVGVLKVRAYRPFNAKDFCKEIPQSCEVVTVLDRTKENGSVGEPLYLDVVSALMEENRKVKVLGGRYGLGSKDFTPAMAIAVIDNSTLTGKNHFTVGIDDDIMKSSLKVLPYNHPYNGTECLFFGLGSDGTVSANKNSIKIIGDNTSLYAQGYFVYDSKKSGSITISHLRFGKNEIASHYEIEKASFVACHNESFIGKYDILSHINSNGTFLLNCEWTKEELENRLPKDFKKTLFEKNINFYIINGVKLAQELGLKGKISTIMQSAFFYLTNIIDYDLAKEKMKKMAEKSYGKAGPEVVQNNFKAIDLASTNLQKINIPSSWKNANNKLETYQSNETSEFNENIIKPIAKQLGNSLKVSAFSADGSVPTNTTRFEKRGIAISVPKWIKENCIQCNMCSFVCPHGAIKPVLLNKETKRPETFSCIKAQNTEKYDFRIQISPLDCTGCGSCAGICPSLKKALVMSDAITEIKEQKENYEFAQTIQNDTTVYPEATIKGSQFKECLFKFSGACAGCGETPYIKLATQLFGENMIIANATGCSSIYGGSFPTCPYSQTKDGFGPAWANSLFEDNAEFGFGMQFANKTQKDELNTLIDEAIALKSKTSALFKEWKNTKSNFAENNKVVKKLIPALEKELLSCENIELTTVLNKISERREALTQKSVWIIGGDGWAYDIGYGGLDHVMASNEDVNILVLDTQVYSNTGGQSSKATPCGATAKFAETGKTTSKKSLALMALNYPNCYVAQVAMGANMMQTINALKEAEAHKGPSIVVCYSTCINQGIDMSKSMEEMKKAVNSGYWHLFRYNPETQKLTLDSPQNPTGDYMEFVQGERRYKSLMQKMPEHAQELLEKAKKDNDLLLQKLILLSQSKKE